MSEFNFDTEGVEPAGSAIPAGTYSVFIETAEHQVSKAGNSEFVYTKLRVEGPSCIGFVLFDRMITTHETSEVAVKIGKSRLASLIHAVGKTTIKDTDELVGHTVHARVRVNRACDGNDVTAYASPKGAEKSEEPKRNTASNRGPSSPAHASTDVSLPDDPIPF